MQQNLEILQDLKLSGVKWEIFEGANTAEKNKNQILGEEPSSVNSNKASQPIIVPVSEPVVLASAKDAVKNVNNYQDLLKAISEFSHPLKQFAKNTVLPCFQNQDLGHGLLIITDMPSGDDDVGAKILTGAAGDLMDGMLGAIGMKRDNVSILPLLFWRTPGGRSATKEELELARPFVLKAIELLSPKAILTLGTLCASEIAQVHITKNHGKIVHYKEGLPGSSALCGIPVMPIYHPNYLILKPSTKRDVWEALQKLQNMLKNS